MNYAGEFVALSVAMMWTVAALAAEVASRRSGALQINVLHMWISLLLLAATLWWTTGMPFPRFASAQAWAWLSLSGLVGYIMGDYCLFNSYIIIGSRFGQLFMTLTPVAATIAGWAILGEKLSIQHLIGMTVTILGISMSILGKEDGSNKLSLKLPLKGILFGIGAGIGQGLGLVLSKVGMNHYATSIPESQQAVSSMIPFASTMIRALVGGLGFTLVMLIRKDFGKIVATIKDKKAIGATLVSTIMGPFIGVSLSLMAVSLTKAGIASTIISLSPILILWPAHMIFKQKVTAREVVGAVISVIGVSLFFI